MNVVDVVPVAEPAAMSATGLLDELTAFARLGRDDLYAERVPPRPPAHPKWRYITRDGALTEALLRQHLNGGPHLGMYLLPALADTTCVAVFDLDDHDGTFDPEKMRHSALAVRAAAMQRGIWTWPLRSGGGRGIHLCAKWDEPQPARDVRALMTAVLAQCGLRVGAGGIERGEVEIFPKQDGLDGDGIGSLIALPFGRESVPLDHDMLPIEGPMLWISSAPVPAAPPEPKPMPTGDPTAAIGDVIAALVAIPNDEQTDFDLYIAVGMAVAAASGGSDDGFAAWDDWAAQRKDKYQARDTKQRWGYWLHRPPSRTGFGALVKRARQHQPGWLPPSQQAPYLSEQWLALSFVAEHRDDMRYTAQWNAWHIWEGACWIRDDTLRAFSLAAATCREVARNTNKPKKAHELSAARTRAAVISLARENQALAAVPDQWNRDPWLLGTPGGTVDLRTGELHDSRPEDYITKSTIAAPAGDCPLWKARLLEISGGDADVASFLQRWFGYCLTGLTREETLLFFLGEGGNGKGTVIETISYVMGDYAVAVPMTTLVKRRHPEHPTEIAKLHGIRFAVASETDDGARINAAMIKLLTGGDKLTARFMRADFFDFLPTHKLVISGNRALILGRVDRALARRWAQVPFTQEFEADKTLKERLRQEAGGILAWQVQGCLEWQRIGLAPPPLIVEATEQYLRDQDDIALFVDEQCYLNDGAEATARELYDGWRMWCMNNGVAAGKLADFVERMKQRFRYTAPQNRGIFHGIGIGVAGMPDGAGVPF